jgi:hypothetical protein
MNINPVNGPEAPRNSLPIEAANSVRASDPQVAYLAAASQAAQAGAVSDRVEFSEDARKLAAGSLPADAGTAEQTASEDRIAAARQKLLSGELSTPAVYEKTAEKLLQSGDLDD